MNLNYILIALIIILIVCIVIKIIVPKPEEFRGLVTRQIINRSQIEHSKQPIKTPETENPENPNDEKANEAVLNLNQINNSVNEKVETFLFLDTPFKSSLNYIIISIENLILKLFKTKSGYIVTNKEVDKVYVPYKQQMRPVPFNPYIPVSRIPKYVYMNIIPGYNNSLYLRKGDYYYYYRPDKYNGGLYSWYQYNNYKNKKETRNLIQSLYDKIKHLEEKAFNSNSNVHANRIPDYKKPPPPINNPPSIIINNSVNKTNLEDKLNKLPIIESSDLPNVPVQKQPVLGQTNIIENPTNQYTKIEDAPSERLNQEIKTYSEPKIPDQNIQEVEEPTPKIQEIQNPQPNIEKEDKANDTEEILSLLESKPKEESIKTDSDIPELPKETFWNKLGF